MGYYNRLSLDLAELDEPNQEENDMNELSVGESVLLENGEILKVTQIDTDKTFKLNNNTWYTENGIFIGFVSSRFNIVALGDKAVNEALDDFEQEDRDLENEYNRAMGRL